MPEQSVKCPRCGQTVAVPTTGEKVHCLGCGQKFRFDAPAAPVAPAGPAPSAPEAPSPKADEEEAPPAQAPTVAVPCPDCGKTVLVPVSGDKVFCACGRKFRLDTSQDSPKPAEAEPLPEIRPPELPRASAAEPPALPSAAAAVPANEVKCPRCGRTVLVPLTGEKVHCQGCGQKFRFEAPAARPRPEESAALPGIASPDQVLAMAAAATVAGPGPDQAADELRVLWPSLRGLVNRVFEEHRATDDDRMAFRSMADRAAGLAAVFLGPPGPQSPPGHLFITCILPEMTLDEILRLSLEEYRRLDDAFDEVRRLTDARVAQVPELAPSPPLPRQAAVAPPSSAPVALPAARRRGGLSPLEAVTAVVSIAALAAVAIFFPELRDWMSRLKGQQAAHRLQAVTTETVAVPKREGPARPDTKVAAPSPKAPTKNGETPKATTATPALPDVKIPEFVKPEPPAPKAGTATAVPPDVAVPEPPGPPEHKTETPAVAAPGAGLTLGIHRLFNGRDLTNWGRNGAWAVRDGAVVGRAAAGPVASLITGNPEWRDYTVQARCRIVRADRQTREGEYYLIIFRYQDADNFYCVRFPIEGIYEIGYYRNGAFHEVGRARHGLGAKFNQWHDVEIGVHGDQVSVTVDNARTGAPPWVIKGIDRGPVGIGVTGGEATFDLIRVRAER